MAILLVDTDGDSAVLASALRVEGCDVVTCSSATGARSALASQPIALAIVDLLLRGDSGVSGLDFAREIRRRHPEVRVFLTSSYHLSARQLERCDCGVSGFIPKPYDLAETVQFLRAKASSPPSCRPMECRDPQSATVSNGFPSPPCSSAYGHAPSEIRSTAEEAKR